MKYLIIYVHPNEQSLNAHLKNMVEDHLKKQGHEVILRDLYQLNFNPVLSKHDLAGQRLGTVSRDVQTEQEQISWADCIIFIHPIWWTGLPAMLKGYIERTFSYGFAYQYEQGIQKGLLTGKKAIIINTQGKSHNEYRDLGMDKALLLTSDIGIYIYCGLEVEHHIFLDRADKADSEIIATWTNQIKSLLVE